MEKIRRYKIPIYRARLIIIITDDVRQAGIRNFGYDIGEGFGGMLITSKFAKKGLKTNQYGIILSETSPETIAHEALHAVHAIFEFIQYQPDIRNDEPECYLLGYIVGLITKAI